MSKYQPGPFLKSLSKGELHTILQGLKEDLAGTPLNHHLFVPTQDAVDVVELELNNKEGERQLGNTDKRIPPVRRERK